MNINEIHKARRMLNAIYRLADEPGTDSMSDIRYFARAGVIQLNRILDQASQEDTYLRTGAGMAASASGS